MGKIPRENSLEDFGLCVKQAVRDWVLAMLWQSHQWSMLESQKIPARTKRGTKRGTKSTKIQKALSLSFLLLLLLHHRVRRAPRLWIWARFRWNVAKFSAPKKFEATCNNVVDKPQSKYLSQDCDSSALLLWWCDWRGVEKSWQVKLSNRPQILWSCKSQKILLLSLQRWMPQ